MYVYDMEYILTMIIIKLNDESELINCLWYNIKYSIFLHIW